MTGKSLVCWMFRYYSKIPEKQIMEYLFNVKNVAVLLFLHVLFSPAGGVVGGYKLGYCI